MKFGILILPVLAATVLSGCGVVAKETARSDMFASKLQYTNCLKANPSNLSVCEGYRIAYETDLKTYRATSAGMMPGVNNTINWNSSSQ